MKYSIEKEIDKLGRIVLPKGLREFYGIFPQDTLYLTPLEDGILITKEKAKDMSKANESKEKE